MLTTKCPGVHQNNSIADFRPKYTTALIIYDLSNSLAILKKSEMYNVNANKIFHMIFDFIPQVSIFLRQTAHSRDILLLDILLSVLQFFQFYLILPIFTPSDLNFFFYFYIFWNLIYILFWKFAACSFLIDDWLKTSGLEKWHIWLIVMLKNRQIFNILYIICHAWLIIYD